MPGLQRWSPIMLLGLALACVEPNPYAQGESADTSGDASTTDDPPGCGEPACSLGLEVVEFSVQGGDSFTTSIPKPAAQSSVPIAAVHTYEPGQSSNFGFAITWTDEGDRWGLEVATSNAAPNSRVRGVAAVIGLGDDFAPPELHELEITTADGCGELSTAALDGRTFFDTVERYEPGDAEVFEFSRTAAAGDATTIEYCVTQPDGLDATLGVKLIALDLPEGALAASASATLDSAAGASADFAELGEVSELVHLIGAQALAEASEPALGWTIDCAAQAPYGCSFNLAGFKAGAAVEVGGGVLAIQ